MKKMFSICLALSMLAVFAACSAQKSAPDSTQEGVVTTQASEAESTTAGGSTTGQDTASQGDVTTAQTEGETSQSAANTSTTQASKSTTQPTQKTTAKPPVKTSGTTGGTDATTKPAEEAQSLSKLMELVYTDYESRGLKTTEVKAGDTEYYFGLKDLQFEEALASEPMMSSVAHSICLVRVADGADIAQLKKDIKENVNSYKWVCVGVEKDQVIVDSVGNTIILIMDSHDPELIRSNFLQYAK